MNPYATLGIDEGENDERKIKRAYARLIKQHRPDRDPEGFAKIHHAYQWLLARRERGAEGEAPVVSAAEASPAAVVVTEPTKDVAWEKACELVHAADGEPPGDVRAAAAAVAITAMVEVLQRGGGNWQRAHDLIIPLVHDQPRHWDDVPAEAVARVLEHEPTCLEDRVLYLLKLQRSNEAAGLLAAWIELQEHGGGIPASAVPVVERMMRWCVFFDFALASRIASLMERHTHGLALSRCDLALAAGHAAKAFPPEMLPVLVAIFSGAGRIKPAVTRSVGDHVRKLGRKHPVSRMMATCAPSMLRTQARRGSAPSESGVEPILRLLLTMLVLGSYGGCQLFFGGPPLWVFLIGAFVLSLLYQGIRYLVWNRSA